MDTTLRAPVDEVWSWLAAIPDPEIPVISIVDLGIVRNVAWRDDTLVVTVTPTYSGCPATSAINLDIERELAKRGVTKVRLERQLSPAWTTAWLSPSAREKLRGYGIVPPVEGTAACGSGRAETGVIDCPRCGSSRTERMSQYGSTPCKATYRCTACLEPFEYFKCI
jgi:ring-1,2-phenylacetyl-CoA epoxidase subunit PaaD